MKKFSGQDPRSYSFYFYLNIWFRARKVTGPFEKRAPDQIPLQSDMEGIKEREDGERGGGN